MHDDIEDVYCIVSRKIMRLKCL